MAGDFKDDVEIKVEERKRQHEYEIEDAIRALIKAEEVKKDKKLYNEVVMRMKSITGGK